MISELKLWKRQLGMMLNFGLPRANIKRIPFSEKPKELWEDYAYFQGNINDAERDLMLKLREAILLVYDSHGLGYGKTVYQKLVEAELTYQKIKYTPHPQVDVKYDDEIIRKYKMKFLLVEDCIILGVTALQKESHYEILKIQTYLKALGLKIGLHANFGKSQLELRGVKR